MVVAIEELALETIYWPVGGSFLFSVFFCCFFLQFVLGGLGQFADVGNIYDAAHDGGLGIFADVGCAEKNGRPRSWIRDFVTESRGSGNNLELSQQSDLEK